MGDTCTDAHGRVRLEEVHACRRTVHTGTTHCLHLLAFVMEAGEVRSRSEKVRTEDDMDAVTKQMRGLSLTTPAPLRE